MKFKEYLETEQVLNEKSLNRFLDQILTNEPWGIMTAFRSNYTKQQNIQRNVQLEKILKDKEQLNYTRIMGGSTEKIDNKEVDVTEDSLFIRNISKEQLHNLGNMFDQDSVLWGKLDTGIFIITKDNKEIKLNKDEWKNIDTKDMNTAKKELFTRMTLDAVKEYFTVIKRKKFKFKT